MVILQKGSKGKLLQEGSKGEKVLLLKTNSASLLQNVRTRRTRTPRPHETAIFVETDPTLQPTTTTTTTTTKNCNEEYDQRWGWADVVGHTYSTLARRCFVRRLLSW